VSELGISQLSAGANGGGGGDTELAAALKIASSSDKELYGKMESPRQMRFV
jgi:hypothetical protein